MTLQVNLWLLCNGEFIVFNLGLMEVQFNCDVMSIKPISSMFHCIQEMLRIKVHS